VDRMMSDRRSGLSGRLNDKRFGGATMTPARMKLTPFGKQLGDLDELVGRQGSLVRTKQDALKHATYA
jgi:hypothetical protein